MSCSRVARVSTAAAFSAGAIVAAVSTHAVVDCHMQPCKSAAAV